MAEEIETIVIDNGSSFIKAGLAGYDAPSSIFPTFVGHPKSAFQSKSASKNIYVGDEACAKSGTLILKSPIERGIIVNWDDIEKIWHHTFYNELRVDPADHPVLLTESIKCPKSHREKMIQIMIETFNVPSFFVCPQPCLSLCASGRITGLVCEMGDGVTQFAPFFNCFVFKHNVTISNLAGSDVTNYLQKLLQDRGHKFTTSSEKEIVRDIKEKHGFVSLNYDKELQESKKSSSKNVSYSLPNGKSLTLSSECFMSTELLFKPYLNDFDSDGLDQMIFNTIKSCNIGARKLLCANIVLSGGAALLKGLPERIEKEMVDLEPPTMQIKVVDLDYKDRKFGAWVGGSIFASLPTFPRCVITHDEYNDVGPAIVHNKCI